MIEEKLRVPERLTRMVARAEESLVTDKKNARNYVKLVRGVLPRKRAKRSNLFVRKAHAFVENATARDVAAIFQFKPYFDVESRTSARVTQADNSEKVLQYYLEKAELELKAVGWFKQSVTENVGLMKLGWRRAERVQKQRMPLDEAMKLENFKLPPELADKHIFLASDGSVAMDENGTMVVHEGDEDEASAFWTEQGYVMTTLDQAPREVQNQFTAVVKAPKVLYDGLELTPVEFQDCFWDPDASNIEELRFVGHHCGKTLEDLKREEKSGVPYKNLDKMEEMVGSSAPNLARYTRRTDIGKSDTSRVFDEDTLFRVTEIWDLQEGKLYTYVGSGQDTTYGDSGLLIREEDHPYWHNECPYHFLPATIIPFELMGVGIPEIIEHLLHERNELRNIAMDNKVFAIMPPMFYDENSINDPQILANWEPGRKIPVNLPPNTRLDDLVKVIEPNVTALQNIEFLIRTIDADMEETTGVTKVAQGIPISRRTTYSEQSLLSSESNVRFRMRIMLIDLVMKRLAKQALKLLDQFVDPQVEVPITGDDGNRAFLTVDREDLSFEYDIYPASSSVENLASMQVQAQNMIQGYGGIKGTAMEALIKPAPFLREYFRKLGVKDSARFIKTDEEIQQEIQQAQMAQQQQVQPQQNAPAQEPAPDETDLINEENRLILEGADPAEFPVSPRNNHQVHLEGHEPIRQQIEQELMVQGVNPEDAQSDPRVIALITHLGEHMQFMEGASEQAGEGVPQGAS